MECQAAPSEVADAADAAAASLEVVTLDPPAVPAEEAAAADAAAASLEVVTLDSPSVQRRGGPGCSGRGPSPGGGGPRPLRPRRHRSTQLRVIYIDNG